MGKPEDIVTDDLSATGAGPEIASEAVDAADAAPETIIPEVLEAPVEPEPVAPPTPEERLRAQLNEVTAKLRTVSKAYTDMQAELPEIRRRFELQAEGKVERKTAEAVEAFLDPVMNLRRSLEAGGDDPQALLSGLQIVLHQFQAALEKLGLVEIPGVGAKFDPDLHEALAVMPVTEPEQDGKVIVVYSIGYQIRGRTLKAAQVVIGKLQEAAEA